METVALYSALTSERRGSSAASKPPLLLSSIPQSRSRRVRRCPESRARLRRACGGSGDGLAEQSRSWRCHQRGPHLASVVSLPHFWGHVQLQLVTSVSPYGGKRSTTARKTSVFRGFF